MFPENPLALSLQRWLVPSTKQLSRAGEQRGATTQPPDRAWKWELLSLGSKKTCNVFFKEFAKRIRLGTRLTGEKA